MTWTYTPGWLSVTGSTGQMTRVRLMIGDTDTTRQLVTDEEIYWSVDEAGSSTYAAAAMCDVLAAKFAHQVNTQNSELRVSAAARHKHYLSLADRLRRLGPGEVPGGEGAGVPLGTMYVGGAKVSEKQALDDNSDLVPPQFSVGMDDYPDNSVANRTADSDSEFDI